LSFATEVKAKETSSSSQPSSKRPQVVSKASGYIPQESEGPLLDFLVERRSSNKTNTRFDHNEARFLTRSITPCKVEKPSEEVCSSLCESLSLFGLSSSAQLCVCVSFISSLKMQERNGRRCVTSTTCTISLL
jgi:hypothetical protein